MKIVTVTCKASRCPLNNGPFYSVTGPPTFSAESADMDVHWTILSKSRPPDDTLHFALGSKRFCISASSIAEITSPLTLLSCLILPPLLPALHHSVAKRWRLIGLRDLLQTGESGPQFPSKISRSPGRRYGNEASIRDRPHARCRGWT